MIIHYKNGTTNFDGMDNIITPICISCTNERELNGIWIAELLIIKDNQLRFKEIELNDYIKIPTPSGEQLFRIKYIDDTAKHAIRIECKHIFFDLEDRIVWDTFIQDRNGQQALEQVLNNLDETTPFTAFSNISNRNNLRLVRTKGVTSILGGGSKENYLIERYKAELDIDNFNIKLLDRVGLDRGYQIREGKNLTGFEYSEDSTSLCTRILPVLFDGVTIPEKYVDSPLVSKYPHVYSNIIKFDDIKLKEKDADGNFDPEDLGFETEEAMYVEARKRCLDLFEKERIDRVKINAAVNFIDLKKTEQYKDLEFIQRLDLGDTVEFIIESYKLTAKERVIRYVYNSLLEDYEEIEIGRESDSFFKGMDEIKNTIDDYLPVSNGLNSKFDDWYNKVIKDVTSQIQTGMKDSYVLVRENEILIMDTTDISTAQKVWRWNRGGLGFSSNGYNGTYTTAMTSDGQFVVNEITCQKFVGNLIQAGTIQADRLSVEAKKTLREGLVTETNFNVGIDGILATVKAVDSKTETLKENFTEFKQSSENLQMKIEKSGTYNLLKNSRPRLNLTRWRASFSENNSYGAISGHAGSENFEGEYFRSGIWLKGNRPPTGQEGWFILANDSLIDYKFNMNKKYTCSFYIWSEFDDEIDVQIMDGDGTYHVMYTGDRKIYGGIYNKIEFTFQPLNIGNEPEFRISFTQYAQMEVNVYVPWVNLYEGEAIHKSHIQDEKGFYQNIMTVDERGLKCEFENGNKAAMETDGFYYRTGDGQWEYHALSLVGEARIASESTRYIYLPEVFRGKRIKVICQVGQIGTGTDAISNPKPLISFWAGADDLQNNPSGYAPYFRLYGSTRLRNNDGSVAYQDKEVLITYTVLA